MSIYNADGFLDRGKVQDELTSILFAAGVAVPGGALAKLNDLLDECAEGFTSNPLDSPTMVTEYINTCRTS